MHKKAHTFILGSVLTLFSVLCGVFFTLGQPPQVKITACDVGQGDAIIIQYGERRILIDSGPNSAILRCLPRVTFFGMQHIDVAILTHWDKDHAGGFASVLQNFTVDTVFVNETEKTTQMATELKLLLEERGVSLVPQVGDELVFPGLRLRFLWNEEMLSLESRQKPASDENAASVGTLILGQGFGFLALGDLECTQELAVSSLPLLTSPQILKVSHHGAKTSSCLEFLEKIRPEIGLISVGAGNSYGHPAPQTLDFLRKTGTFVLRTDELGTFSLRKEATGWKLDSER